MDYSKRHETIQDKPSWNFSSVIDILNDEIYTGTYVYNRIDKSLVNGTKKNGKAIPKEIGVGFLIIMNLLFQKKYLIRFKS